MHLSTQWFLASLGWAVALASLSGLPLPVRAQITPDETLGNERSQVEQGAEVREGRGDRIVGGAARGSHLFHSFREFNVNAGERVYFANPAGIERIVGRVTGTDISDIFGTLGVEGTADLFLLNPNGFVFGADAQLDLRGSFVVSTGDRFSFPDGSDFSATNPQAPPLLTVSVPIGLQRGHGNIDLAADLSVPTGQHLTLHGNRVDLTGSLTAPAGRVEVWGDRINLLDHSTITTSSPTSGGTILIGGSGSPLVPTSRLTPSSFILPPSSFTTISPTANLHADAIDTGNGGTVIIWAEDTTEFAGMVSARGGAIAGNGGFVEVSGRDHLIFQGTVDTRAPNGMTGTLLLDPTNIRVVAAGAETADLNQVNAFGTPDLGGDNETRLDVAAINSATSNVILQASQNIIFDAAVSIPVEGIGLTAQAGDTIAVNNVLQTNGGTIQLLANDPASGAPSGTGAVIINANTFSNGGNIFLSGNDIAVNNGARVRTNSPAQDSGDLVAIADNQVLLQGGAELSVSSFGAGAVGNLLVVGDAGGGGGEPTPLAMTVLCLPRVEVGATGGVGGLR
ncbi:MAG: filamentous hemagglutinin N-terminal domain-containing protein, partial [Leptolyngbyaceae cyanobacterium SL_7_1]|nr:filamentous hemagglutinin N-terminal domain-containing protein [Leptolyngbyaceae cyanobacterium SL_7_1]